MTSKPVGFQRWRDASDAAKARYARRRKWRESQTWLGKILTPRVTRGLTACGLTLMFLALATPVMAPVMAAKLPIPDMWDFPAGKTMSEHSSWDGERRLVVVRDGGGRMLERISYIRWLREKSVSVEVREVCLSACTFYLTLDDVCTHPAAMWMFHTSRLRGQEEGTVDHINKLNDWASLFEFPEPLRSWLRKEYRGMRYEDEIRLLGQELIDRGWVAECADASPEDSARTLEILHKIRPNPLPQKP